MTRQARELYTATGLSHLTAVSGSNVAIVTGCVLGLAAAVKLPVRVRVVLAGVALAVFVLLVGTEPSVLRAAVTGYIGLVALLTGSRAKALRSLSIAVAGLCTLDSDMAASYGFALSVAATVGVVAVYPRLEQPVARLGFPAIVARAVAIALAADVVTAPIIALMAGRFSTVAVAANVLAAPAVAPVTVLGFAAVIMVVAHVPAAVPGFLVALCVPFVRWIDTVAAACGAIPLSTVPLPDGPAGVVAAVLVVLWMLTTVHTGKASTAVVLLSVAVVAGLCVKVVAASPPVDVRDLNPVTVATVADAAAISAGSGIGLIVVTDCPGRRRNRPTVTPEGIPVVCPNRDGPVTIHRDGTQHAADGRF